MLLKAYPRINNNEHYETYQEARKETKEKIKTAKAQEWEGFGSNMERNCRSNQKLFYSVLKIIKNGQRKTERDRLRTNKEAHIGKSQK